jgi:CHASE3 domain sensor protein
MMDEIRKEIRNIEKSAERLKSLAKDNNAIQKNAEIILTYLYILKFITPVWGEEDQ